MTLAALIANDADIFDDLVSGTFTNPDTTTRASTKLLQFGRQRTMVTINDVQGVVVTCHWSVPVSDMSTFVPVKGGYITDASGNKWRIDKCELLTRATRFSIDTTLEGGVGLR